MNNHNEDKWLAPLKNRAGLEPDPKFVRELKASLLKAEDKHVKSRKHFWNFKVMASMSFAVLLFSIITISLLNSKDDILVPSGEQPIEIVNEPDANEKVHQLDFSTLIEENSAYKKIYDEVFLRTEDDMSTYVVFYFEALRLQNEKFVEQYSYEYTDVNMTAKLMEFYKNVDFTSIEVIKVRPIQAEHAFDIFFSYHDLNSNTEKLKSVVLEIPNHNQAYINDSLVAIEAVGDYDGGQSESKGIELTEEEFAIYTAFKESHNDDLLLYQHPISIAKMYIQADIDGDWETRYEFYTTREDRIMWSKEQHKEYFEQENTSPEKTQEMFSGIEDGEFIQTSVYEGYISFQGKNGEMGFQMVKDENGVWKVGFMPIQ